MSDMDDDELKATRRLNGADKYSEADEMFKKLGFKKKERYTGDDYIDKYGLSIFFRNTKMIDISTLDDNGDYSISELSPEELQAINKKCEELGWL